MTKIEMIIASLCNWTLCFTLFSFIAFGLIINRFSFIVPPDALIISWAACWALGSMAQLWLLGPEVHRLSTRKTSLYVAISVFVGTAVWLLILFIVFSMISRCGEAILLFLLAAPIVGALLQQGGTRMAVSHEIPGFCFFMPACGFYLNALGITVLIVAG